MFEQELEMEEREASAIPLLLIVALILAIVGVAGYFLWQNHASPHTTRGCYGDQRCRCTKAGHDSMFTSGK